MLESIVIALSILAQTAAAQDVKALERQGEELLGAKCARCHAILRTGESPHSAAPAFRTLEFVFETDEIAAILAYLKSIQER